MDGDRFDNIARALASGRSGPAGGLSRRRFIGGLAAAVSAAGLLPARRTEAQVTQAYCGNKTCRNNPGRCKVGCVCCDYGNGNARCRPPGTCGTGTEVSPAPATTTTTTTPAPCVPSSTCPAGVECGTAPDGCGGIIACGECTAPETCSEVGTCACPPGTCGERCALVVCPDGSCKQGATGTCTGDSDCCSGVCVAGVCQGGCVAEGGACDSGTDCCAGACVTPGGGGNQLCCASGTACGANCCADAAQVCDGSGACCTPNTCQPGRCGQQPNGCGGALDCGVCTEPGEICGGGGTPGVCGSCTPTDPATACAGTCGTVSDGCEGTINCRDHCAGCCTLAVNSICVTGDANGACGADGEHCHTCLTPDTCGGGGDPHVCGCTSDGPAVTCAGKCGTVLDNCGREIDCSGCGGGLICCDGNCVDASNDPNHCGSCGRLCVSDPDTCTSSVCNAGNCISIAVFNCCKSDDDCFNSDINPCTVDTCDPQTLTCRHDSIDCGSSQTCCHEACVDLSNDPANCGACGNTCTENQPCEPCPPGQFCPDRGPGCCETGTCQAGRCTSKVLRICGNCATPICDPDLGSICVDNCPPPPNACSTGEGVCQFGGTCTYEPKCGPCETCDPDTGNCLPKTCRSCETCDPSSDQCVSACTNAPNLCHIEPGSCNDDGTCSYTPKDCGPCKGCDSSDGQCKPTRVGWACGTCHQCKNTIDGDSICVPVPAGTGCGECGVCNDNGSCELSLGDGGLCRDLCHRCQGGLCLPVPAGTLCAKNSVCDAVGTCVCNLPCGDTCCPEDAVDCCVAEDDNEIRLCCLQQCVTLPSGFQTCTDQAD